MAYPVTLNGRTYTLADFEGTNYVEGLPDAFEDFVTHAGDIYNSTSTTSNSIGTGSKTFTVESAKPYQAGTPLRIADAAAPSTNFMDTIVTSYSGTTLIVDAVGYAGSGTFTSWNVNIGGAASVAGTVAIAQGGTGATTAAAARTNLDVYSKADADSRFLNVSGEASDVTMTGNVTIGDAAGDTLTVNATPTFATRITSAGLTSSASIVSTSNSNNLGNTTIAALTASSLTSSGSISISGNSNTLGATTFSGAVTIPAFINHDGDGDTFMGFPGPDAFRLDIAGSERITADASSFVLNDDGGDVDFRVESDSNTHALFVNAGLNAVGINETTPNAKLHITTGSNSGTGLEIETGLDNGSFSNPVAVNITQNGGTVSEGVYPWYASIGGAQRAYQFVSRNGASTGSKVVHAATDSGNVMRTRMEFTNGETTFNEGSRDFDFRVESDGKSHMLFVDASNDAVQIGSNMSQSQGALDVGFSVNSDTTNVVTIMRGVSGGNTSGATSMGFPYLTIGSSEYVSGGHYRGIGFGYWIPNNGYASSRPPAEIAYYDESTSGGTKGSLVFGTRDTINGNDVPVERLRIHADGKVTINDTGTDSDFRVESNNQSHMLFIDANEDHIAIKHDNPNAELDVKGEQVLRGNTNNGGITQMADSGAYTTSTSSTDIFRIYGLSNNSAEITIIFADGSYRNGSMIQKIYVSCHGSGTAPAGPNVVVENKSRAHNGTFPSHFTWSVSTSGSYATFSCTANQTISGAGTLHVHVNSIGYTGGKSLEMLI